MTLAVTSRQYDIAGNIPFDILGKITRDMGIDFKQVCGLEEVSKLWKARLRTNHVWQYQFDREKYPLVEGRKRQYKDDFIVLHPIAVSARSMSCLGEFVGVVPKISEKDFNRLFQEDPFKCLWDPAGDVKLLKIGYIYVSLLRETLCIKRFTCLNEAVHLIQTPTQRTVSKIKDGFQMIIEPHFFKRPYEKNLVDDLAKYGDFRADGPHCCVQKGLLVPYTLKNVIVLSNHPLKHHPSFYGFRMCINEAWMDEDSKGIRTYFTNKNAVYDRCNVLAEKVNIYFTREKKAYQTENFSFHSQLAWVRKHNFQITPLRVRTFLNLVGKIESGSWPDGLWENGSLETHTAETFQVYDELEKITVREWPTIVAFGEDQIDIDPEPSSSRNYGIFPGFPAEDARQPRLFIQYPGQRPILYYPQGLEKVPSKQ